MIEGKKVLGLIPARGGSKGVPGKNLVKVCGKPLIAWTIEAAQKSEYIDRLVLSSDAADIISVGTSHGCEAPFIRPPELADDRSTSADVIIHAMDYLGEEFDYIVLLQPTSPFRQASDIDSCLRLCHERGAPAAVSLSIVDKAPAWMYKLERRSQIKPIFSEVNTATRRQDLEEIYALNGAVFVSRNVEFRKTMSFIGTHTVGLIMPAERSIDIDSPLDVIIANAICEAMTTENH
jgi:CMP-N,N'-diacetyllegionaminic acid synthase